MPVKTQPKSEGHRPRGIIVKWAAAAAIAVVVGLVVAMEMYFSRSEPPASPGSPAAIREATAPLALPSTDGTTPKTFVVNPGASLLNATPEAQMATVVGNIGEKFHVDAKGRLVQNEQTRLHIEALFALTDPDKLYDTIQEEVRDLPKDAAARAMELMERYKIYIADQQKLYPPGTPVVNEDEMQAQMDGLHALRVAHFGAKTAEAMYGDEEKLNYELLQLMRVEKDPTLTMEQKAERAQALRSKLQRITAIENANVQAGQQALRTSTEGK